MFQEGGFWDPEAGCDLRPEGMFSDTLPKQPCVWAKAHS